MATRAARVENLQMNRKTPRTQNRPEPVAEIEPSAVTADRLSLRWPAATDDVGVIGYRIWLNGFEVATTAETEGQAALVQRRQRPPRRTDSCP